MSTLGNPSDSMGAARRGGVLFHCAAAIRIRRIHSVTPRLHPPGCSELTRDWGYPHPWMPRRNERSLPRGARDQRWSPTAVAVGCGRPAADPMPSQVHFHTSNTGKDDTFAPMKQDQQVLLELDAAGVIDGIRWAHRSAYDQVLREYDPASGHSHAWLGIAAHTLLCDRLDRAFSCGRYAVDDQAGAATGFDVVADGLPQSDVDEMPRLDPGVVVPAPLNGSPGWRNGPWRLLLQSHPFGAAMVIPWAQHSETKRRVASEPDDAQLAFDPAVLGTAPLPDQPAPTTNLVLAHGVDTVSGAAELHLGRPRFNPGGGRAWHWCWDLLHSKSPRSGRITQTQTRTAPDRTNDVPDAPVRLRPSELGLGGMVSGGA